MSQTERARIEALVQAYSQAVADHLHAPTHLDLLAMIDRAKDTPDQSEGLNQLLRAPTRSAVVLHFRWELFQAPRAPTELGDWRYGLAQLERKLKDDLAFRDYVRKHHELVVEGPNGIVREVRIEAKPSSKERAFNDLVIGLAAVWGRAGLTVTVRKDEQKARQQKSSPFVEFLHDVLSCLPRAYRRNSKGALATAASKALAAMPEKTKPDRGQAS